MSYIRNAPKQNLEALRIQRQIAAAAVEKAEAELAAVVAEEQELAKLQRRRIEAAKQLDLARNRAEEAARQLAQPAIIWGGTEGLKRAAEESARWDKRRRILTGQVA